MFDLSWGEVMVIGAVALIVIGPKDLPKALRTVGNMTSKVRRMASEFQSQFNDAVREAELDDIRKQVESVNQSVTSLNTGFNPIETVRDELKGAIEAPVGAGTAPQAGIDAATPVNETVSVVGEPALPPGPAQSGLAPAAEEKAGRASADTARQSVPVPDGTKG